YQSADPRGHDYVRAKGQSAGGCRAVETAHRRATDRTAPRHPNRQRESGDIVLVAPSRRITSRLPPVYCASTPKTDLRVAIPNVKSKDWIQLEVEDSQARGINARQWTMSLPVDSLVAIVVADSCYHAATTPSRSRVIYRHLHSVAIVGVTSA